MPNAYTWLKEKEIIKSQIHLNIQCKLYNSDSKQNLLTLFFNHWIKSWTWILLGEKKNPNPIWKTFEFNQPDFLSCWLDRWYWSFKLCLHYLSCYCSSVPFLKINLLWLKSYICPFLGWGWGFLHKFKISEHVTSLHNAPCLSLGYRSLHDCKEWYS